MVKNVLKKNEKRRKNNKGFSLVELIVVIAIMAVLVGVLAPQLIKYVEKSREATDIQNCDSIATALKTYFADKENITGTAVVTVTTTPTPSVEGTGATVTTNNITDALTAAGLNTTKLKGTGWGTSGIVIKYDTATGKVTYTANSDHYHATNSDKIEAGKATSES